MLGKWGRAATAASLGALALLAPAAAGATEIHVETPLDVSVMDSECSLREALQSANTNAAVGGCEPGNATNLQDIIRVPAGTYTLQGAAGDDANATGDLDYTGGGPIAIDGEFDANGPTTTIKAPPSDRVFDAPATVPNGLQLLLTSLNITDGRALGAAAEGDGGAVRIAVPNVDVGISGSRITGSRAARNGGAVSYETSNAFGTIRVEGSELAGNAAGTAVAQGSGGAIWSGVADNSPIITGSTLAANSAAGIGGAVALNAAAAPPVMTFRNATLSGNSAGAGAGAVGFSGTMGPSQVGFEFSTIAGNTSTAASAALQAAGANQQFLMRASILSGNAGAGGATNCSAPGTFTSQGNNVESSNSCSLAPPNDLVNTDPLLAPLAVSTAAGASRIARTNGLYDGSPAIDLVLRTGPDRCDDMYTDGMDGRGVLRPAAPDGKCDAGAFEGTVGPKPVAVTPITTVTPPPSAVPSGTPPKKCKKGQKLKKGKCVKKKRKRK